MQTPEAESTSASSPCCFSFRWLFSLSITIRYKQGRIITLRNTLRQDLFVTMPQFFSWNSKPTSFCFLSLLIRKADVVLRILNEGDTIILLLRCQLVNVNVLGMSPWAGDWVSVALFSLLKRSAQSFITVCCAVLLSFGITMLFLTLMVCAFFLIPSFPFLSPTAVSRWQVLAAGKRSTRRKSIASPGLLCCSKFGLS